MSHCSISSSEASGFSELMSYWTWSDLILFLFYRLFFDEDQRWPIRVVVLLDPSISLGKKITESRCKYLLDKVLSNGEIENGETFRIFFFFWHLDLVISQIGNEMEKENLGFSMKRKSRIVGRIVFCVKMSQLFILSCLTTMWKILLYIPFENTRALFCFSLTVDENVGTAHLIKGFVF